MWFILILTSFKKSGAEDVKVEEEKRMKREASDVKINIDQCGVFLS